jgi:hypothetical protein
MTRNLPAETRQALTQYEMIAPGAGTADLLTRSPARNKASAADLADQTPRPGSLQGLGYPSRIGNRLHWRDGRVTDLHGNPTLPLDESAP